MQRNFMTVLFLAALLLVLSGEALAGFGISTALLHSPMFYGTWLGLVLLILALKWRLNPSWGRSVLTALAAWLAASLANSFLVWGVLPPTYYPESPWHLLEVVLGWFTVTLVVEMYIARKMLRGYEPARIERAVLLANGVCFGFLAGVLIIPWIGRALSS